MRDLFRDILHSGHVLDLEQIESKKIQLVNFILLLGIPLASVFTLFNEPIYQVVNGIIVIIDTSAFFYLRASAKNLNKSITLLLIALYLSHVTAIFQGGILNSGFLWVFLFPLFAVFLTERKIGSAWISFLIASLLLGYLAISYLPIEVPYTPEYIFFIILVLSIESSYVLFSHNIQKSYEHRVSDANDRLKRFNIELERRLEEELLIQREKDTILSQQGRLAAMGEMMTNIAHQWKQPLGTIGVITQNIQFCKVLEDKDLDTIIDDSTNEIMIQVELMNQTIADFINYVRPSKHKKEFEVQNIVQQAFLMLSDQFKHKSIEVRFDTLTEKIYILGLENEFMHVVMNILNNAKDALLETKVENPTIDICFIPSDNIVKLIIEDNAGGIDLDIISKIFEPYFTTKEEGIGTGLGLYMCKKIVAESLNGKIDVMNTAKGACFTLTFNRVYLSE